MRILRTLILILLGGIVAFCGFRVWQEGTYGEGPRDTSGAVTGPAREIAFVANAVGGTISLVDVAAAEVIASLNVIVDGPHVGPFRDPLQSFAQGAVEARGGLNYAQDTDLSRDGTVLYVARGFLGDVAAFDLATGQILWRTPIAGIRADHMDIAPDGRRLYVSALIRGGNVVQVLDAATGRILGAVQAGQWPHDVHVSGDGGAVYVASLGDMQLPEAERGRAEDAYLLTRAATATLEVTRTHSFEAGIRPFQITRDGRTVFAQMSNSHAIVKRDLTTDEPLGRVDLPVAEGVTEADWDFEAPHHGLALSADEATLCAAGRASDYAALVRGADLSVIAVVPVGDAPSWSAFAQGGRVCLLANNRSDDLSIVALPGADGLQAQETHRIALGRGPKHITVGLVPEAVLAALARPR